MTLDDPSSRGIDHVMARAVTDTSPRVAPVRGRGRHDAGADREGEA